jgi:type II secretory pathway predicted ATPase ExeA
MPFVKGLLVKEIFQSNMISGLLTMFELGIATEDIMLTFGDIGCGKSMALRLFIDNLDCNKYFPLYLKSGKMKTTALYKAILTGLKIEPPFRLSDAKILYEKVITEHKKKLILILDDAQDLADDALLEIRNLVSFDVDSTNRICIIIAGQPEIFEKLKYSLFAPVMQRIRLKYQASGMSLKETCKYIEHNLSVSGKANSLFTDDAKSEIFKRTGGIPRLVNMECYKAIIAACMEVKDIIEPSSMPPAE